MMFIIHIGSDLVSEIEPKSYGTVLNWTIIEPKMIPYVKQAAANNRITFYEFLQLNKQFHKFEDEKENLASLPSKLKLLQKQ